MSALEISKANIVVSANLMPMVKVAPRSVVTTSPAIQTVTAIKRDYVFVTLGMVESRATRVRVHLGKNA